MNNLMNSPRLLLGLGVVLMLLGAVLPFLMVLHVLKSTFFLNFFAWGSSVAGMFLGTMGIAASGRGRRD